MNRGNPVESLASAVYSAINNPQILPDIKLVHRSVDSMVRPSAYDIQVIHFPQTWGSTALGFGGFGGAAMTTAYTTVIISQENAAVFFDGRHAYSIDNFDKAFMEDVSKRNMPSVDTATKRYSIAAQ